MSKALEVTWHPLTPRVQRLRQRVPEPKDLLSLGDVKPNLPEDFWDKEPIVRRGMMFYGIVDTVVTPIREDELIIGDMPYHEFIANREVLPTHITPEEREKRRQQVQALLQSLSPEEREKVQNMSREQRRAFIQERMAQQ